MRLTLPGEASESEPPLSSFEAFMAMAGVHLFNKRAAQPRLRARGPQGTQKPLRLAGWPPVRGAKTANISKSAPRPVRR